MLIFKKFNYGLLLNKDEGGGGGGGATPPQNQQPPNPADKKPDDAAGDKGGDDKAADKDKKFSQAELDAIVKDRLERAKKKADADAQKAKEEAETKALEDKQEFQKLAEKRQTRITELESANAELTTKAERADRYEVALKKHRDSQLEGIPDHIKTLLEKMDVAEQVEYLAANRAALTGKPSQLPPPSPDDKKGELTAAQRAEAEKAAQRQYRNRF